MDKKANPDNLLYRYRGFTVDAKFKEFDNAFSLSDKIGDGLIILADAKNNQAEFKSDLCEIKKEAKNID